MRYDLPLIQGFCRAAGWRSTGVSDASLEIDLGGDAVLCFQKVESEDDCAFGFKGTAWHTHGDLMFADRCGNYIEMNYLEVLSALKEGKVLVAERWQNGRLTERWLVHCEYNDELNYMQLGEETRIWRAPRGYGKQAA
jgi:hypothetical protein